MAINSYTKTKWVNDTVPPINETNLDNIEDGIANSIRSYTPDGSSTLMKSITSFRYNQGYVEFYTGPQDQPEDASLWGKAAVRGETGITYVPHIDVDGNLTWTNDGELENPPSVYLRGTKIGYAGEWTEGYQYAYNEKQIDIVSYNDLVYMCTRDKTATVPAGNTGSDWLLLAPKPKDGVDGIDAAQFKICGVWDSQTNYYNNGTEISVVSYEGSTYIALQDNFARRPDISTNDWILAAQRGNTGPQGPQGLQGTRYNWTGEYNDETIYRSNNTVIDLASYNGGTYICLQDELQGINPEDSSKWAPMALSGQNFAPKGSYMTVEELTAAHPTGQYGDIYTVEDDLYYWNIQTSSWYNLGPYRGPQGEQGEPGLNGQNGDPGKDGVGVPTGGLTGQILYKTSNEDYAFAWQDPPDSEVIRYATIPAAPDSWSSVADYYQCTVSVEGMTEESNPIVDLHLTFDSGADDNQSLISAAEAEFGKIKLIETAENSLIFYAFEIPADDITIVIKGS